MANRNGRAIRFHESKLRAMGRVSTGVRGMKLDDGNDEIIGLIAMGADSEDNVMVISEKGFGKRPRHKPRRQGRQDHEYLG